MSIPNWNWRRYLLGSTCEEPAPVSGEILDPPSFAFPLFPPLASLSPLQLPGSSCQPLADMLRRTQTLHQSWQTHQKRFSAFYLPLRQPTDGALAPLFRQLPFHLKEQHGDRRNFNRERIKRCKKTYGIVISILHCKYAFSTCVYAYQKLSNKVIKQKSSVAVGHNSIVWSSNRRAFCNSYLSPLSNNW